MCLSQVFQSDLSERRCGRETTNTDSLLSESGQQPNGQKYVDGCTRVQTRFNGLPPLTDLQSAETSKRQTGKPDVIEEE